jgi:serine/threonine-protein kinase
LAYQSDESGRNEIYVRPFPDISSGKWTVSLGGGSRPLWSHSGRELFYVDGDNRNMMAAQIGTDGTGGFEVNDRLVLFAVDQYVLSANYTPFDISADDTRFLMARRAGAGEEARLSAMILVENWFEELEQKVRR